MVGVVAAVGCEVEGDRQTFLAGRQIASVEGVRLRSRREARVLTNCPRLVHIHRRVWTADEGGGAGDRVERIGVLGVAGDGIAVGAGVDGLDVDLLGCAPDDLLGRIAVRRGERIDRVGGIRRCCGGGEIACAVEVDVGETPDRSRLLCARLVRISHAEAPEVSAPTGVDVVSVSKRSCRVATASMPTRSEPSGFA